MVQAGGYDVVVMDIQIPVMDGLIATALIRHGIILQHLCRSSP
ncbi:response regulator [Loktanella sp. M215]|nr:response regulator [Loktanella sp. M215]